MNITRGKVKFVTNWLALLNIYLFTFVRPHLSYDNIIFDNPVNESLIKKLKKVEYQACLTVTGAIQGTSCVALCKELGLESLQSRRWYRKVIYLLVIFKWSNTKIPIWFYSCIEWQLLQYKSSVKAGTYSILFQKKKISVTLSFPTALECNKLDAKIREIYHPFPDSKNHF